MRRYIKRYENARAMYSSFGNYYYYYYYSLWFVVVKLMCNKNFNTTTELCDKRQVFFCCWRGAYAHPIFIVADKAHTHTLAITLDDNLHTKKRVWCSAVKCSQLSSSSYIERVAVCRDSTTTTTRCNLEIDEPASVRMHSNLIIIKKIFCKYSSLVPSPFINIYEPQRIVLQFEVRVRKKISGFIVVTK